jgi:hypothetical protein
MSKANPETMDGGATLWDACIAQLRGLFGSSETKAERGELVDTFARWTSAC